MNFTEKTLTSEYVFKGKVINVRRDDIEVSNGHKSMREVVEHSGGVTMLAIKDNKNILFVRQFRYPIKSVSLELPAGKLEPNEDPDFAAKRELEEETGYISDNWVNLGYIYTSVGFCDEKLHLYLARDLRFKKENPDEDEIIECEEYSIEQALEMINNGTINDAKTICAILRARKYLEL